MGTLLFIFVLVCALLALLRFTASTQDLVLLDPMIDSPTPREYPPPVEMPTLVDAREGYLGYRDRDIAAAERMCGYVGRCTHEAMLEDDVISAYIDWELGNRPPSNWPA